MLLSVEEEVGFRNSLHLILKLNAYFCLNFQ